MLPTFAFQNRITLLLKFWPVWTTQSSDLFVKIIAYQQHFANTMQTLQASCVEIIPFSCTLAQYKTNGEGNQKGTCNAGTPGRMLSMVRVIG